MSKETATAGSILGDDGSSSSTSTSSSSSRLPQILSRTSLPNLIGDLDAGDVLEAYAVTRTAPLHWPNGYNETIYVHKSAVAIRYPPPSGSSKPPLELTLEYGPQRMGTTLEQEAMPVLQNSFLSWENEGKIYYTTSFETPSWTKANYMASMTGAVFQLLLQRAIDFSDQHKRYQPLRVVNTEDKLLLKSSASHDFVYSVWEGLANAGVELQPILEPHTYALQIHASSIQKVSGVDENGQPISVEAYEFYQSLYQCATAIQTGNYASWEPTASPTLSVAPTMSPTITATPTAAPSVMHNKKKKKLDGKVAPTVAPTVAPSVTEEEEENHNDKRYLGDEEEQVAEEDNEQEDFEDNGNEGELNNENEDKNEDQGTEEGEPGEEDNTDTGQPDNDYNLTLGPSFSPSSSPAPTEVSGNAADKAKEAADKAKEAAQEAKQAAQTPQDNKAADAAEAAANAAQAAADATYSAAAKAAMDDFASGNGDLVTAVLRQCFEDPRYRIAQMNNDTTATFAYLYLDGSNYYRVNLTFPYVDVARVERPLPHPPTTDSGQVDTIDWLLAFFVVLLLVVTILALLQQIGFRIAFQPLQKWFFSPRHYNYEDAKNGDVSDVISAADVRKQQQGQGFSHLFPEDVIPLSMGGRRATASTQKQQKQGIAAQNGDGHLGDVEMVQPPLRQMSSLQSDDSSEQVVVVDLMEQISRLKDSEGMPRRLSRDPDLVDLPNLKSTTKVAVPVSRKGSNSSIN